MSFVNQLKRDHFDQVFHNEISKVFSKILWNCIKIGSEAFNKFTKPNNRQAQGLGPAAVAMTICRELAKK